MAAWWLHDARTSRKTYTASSKGEKRGGGIHVLTEGSRPDPNDDWSGKEKMETAATAWLGAWPPEDEDDMFLDSLRENLVGITMRQEGM